MAKTSKSNDADLFSALECPICMDSFHDPRILPCGHTFCKGCLAKLLANQGICCPTCRKQHNVQPVNLPVNYVVNQLHEMTLGEKKPPQKMNDEEINAHLQDINQVIIRLAYCDAVAEIMEDSVQQMLQTAAQIDLNRLSSMRDVIKTGTADETLIATIKQTSNSVPSNPTDFGVPDNVKERIQQLKTSLSKVLIKKSYLKSPADERKYIAVIFTAFIRNGCDAAKIEHTASEIARRLHEWNSELSQLVCVAGCNIGYATSPTLAETYLALYGIMEDYRVLFFCAPHSEVLKTRPSMELLDVVFSQLCETYEDDLDGTVCIRDKLNEYFPTGWNCIRTDLLNSNSSVVCFLERDSNKVLCIKHETEIYRNIAWVWTE